MKYLIILALCVFATLKVSFQSAYGKDCIKTSTDALVFNSFVFVFSASVFLPQAFGCSLIVWAYAACAALVTVLYQMFYIKALSLGNVSVTVLIVNFNMVLCVIVSYFVYKEPISVIRYAGIILTTVSLVVCTQFEKSGSAKKNWTLFTLLSLAACTLGFLVQKAFGESSYSAESTAFISCMYVTAAFLAFVMQFILNGAGVEKTVKIDFRMMKYALGTGLSLAAFQRVNTYALANVDGTFLFPAYSGGSIVFSAITGVLIFKDVLTKKQVAGIIIGILATVLMNF